MSRVSSVPRAIVYQPSIRQHVERFFVVSCFPFKELYSGCVLCYIVVTNRIEPAHCYVRSQHIVLQIWKHGTCNGIPYQKQSPVLYDMKLCSMEILIFKVLTVLNILKTSLQPLARGIIQISTIHAEKNDKFQLCLPIKIIPLTQLCTLESLRDINIIYNIYSYNIYNILYNINIYVQYNILYDNV